VEEVHPDLVVLMERDVDALAAGDFEYGFALAFVIVGGELGDCLVAEVLEVAGNALAEPHALGELDQMSRGAQARAASLGLPEPTAAVDQQLEQAASLIVYQADRLRKEMNLPAEAIRSYRSAIELFPETRAAQAARARLDEMNASRGDRT
jgi:hypothetical protein